MLDFFKKEGVAIEELTLLLFERMGILLVLTFILTRIPQFRQMLEPRTMSAVSLLAFSFLFGLFGILGTYAGVIVEENRVLSSFWLSPLATEQALAHSALVGVVIGGLMGGPVVGTLAGLLTGAHLLYIGGYAGPAGAIAAPLTGLLAGGVARFFSQERVISPAKALFIGMFAPILLIGAVLVCTAGSDRAIALVDRIGIPMTLTNSVSIAVFTTMLRVALREEERAAAYETERALHIAEAALPHLKQGLTYATAQAVAGLLLRELKAPAVAVTDAERFLAHAGAGAEAGALAGGEPIRSAPMLRAIASGEAQIAGGDEPIQPRHAALGAAVIVPMTEGKRVAGLILLYFRRPQDIRPVELALARGLGQLISYQLAAALHEKMESLMKEAELKLLQAQINPHFLFNTLNAIVSLIRTDPELARHVTTQLGAFMRLNLKVMASRHTTVRQEMALVNAYLDLIRVRFEDRFAFECEMDPELETLRIPPAALQVLVENSIKHGLRDRASGGLIRLELRRSQGGAVIRLEDNGTGIAPDVLDGLGDRPVAGGEGAGIGVFNLNQRLIGLYGKEARLHIENKEEGGCRIGFTVPLAPPEGSETA